ncbi:universal stress protein [Natronorarus salvus]|uniref:universal stress protein n=1 Tax=Natronorarus salvus TaxID=3117733 RepID=UPI002F26260D
MDHPLVATDSSDRSPELIREAGALAEAAGVPLLVLTVVTREEFEEDAAVLETIGDVEKAAYEPKPAEYARNVAESAAADLLSGFDVETGTVGRYVDDGDDRADAILQVAEELGCDYVFLTGRRRSPAGKAIFGDTAQDVLLSFDGYVVTLTD